MSEYRRHPSRWWYLVFAVGLVGLGWHLLSSQTTKTIAFSIFLEKVAAGEVTDIVEIGERAVTGELKDGTRFETIPPPRTQVAPLLNGKVAYTGTADGSPGRGLWLAMAAVVLVFFVWLVSLLSRARGGSSLSALQFGRSRARIQAEKDTMVTFDDVAGLEEAVEEVKEVVDYVRSPERFQALGGRVPKGVLLVGMPGTGKTLLARAVAGEATVPFLSISGADFVEMYVGVGASRVRDMFAQARELAPCILFIDELDALGKARSARGGGGSEEREHTLNQLLVAMDGFSPNSGVIVLAATNRPEVLDPALLRAGRFDRQVVVDRPDVRGRLEILRLHTRKIKLVRNIDLAVIARRTPGFTGADLATLVNEAALLAVRRKRDAVGMAHVEEAIDRVVAGLERRSRLINPREKAVVAVHETGHAMVACLLPHADPLHRVSVIPRGTGVGGMTLQLPREDKGLFTKKELLDRIAVLLGGRVAERLLFDDISTGAANDLQRVTEIAHRMVVEYGMSDRLGAVSLGGPNLHHFLRANANGGRTISEDTAREVDLEIRRIADEQEQRVTNLLAPRQRRLTAIARVLRSRETLDARAFKRLLDAPLKRRDATC